jgi:Short C-terminal domain
MVKKTKHPGPGDVLPVMVDPKNKERIDILDLTGTGLPPGMEDQVREAMEMAQQYMGQMPGAAAATGGDDRIAQLERLAKLRDSGALSDEEFEAEKARLLGG